MKRVAVVFLALLLPFSTVASAIAQEDIYLPLVPTTEVEEKAGDLVLEELRVEGVSERIVAELQEEIERDGSEVASAASQSDATMYTGCLT